MPEGDSPSTWKHLLIRVDATIMSLRVRGDRPRAGRGRRRRALPHQHADRKPLAILEAAYPDACVTLDFKNPFQLLIATILAAQSHLIMRRARNLKWCFLRAWRIRSSVCGKMRVGR